MRFLCVHNVFFGVSASKAHFSKLAFLRAELVFAKLNTTEEAQKRQLEGL
jgi:hypothetical protein